MNPIELIKKYYNPESICFKILINHSQAVAEKALKIAEKFDCHGRLPYIAHGYLGREIRGCSE